MKELYIVFTDGTTATFKNIQDTELAPDNYLLRALTVEGETLPTIGIPMRNVRYWILYPEESD